MFLIASVLPTGKAVGQFSYISVSVTRLGAILSFWPYFLSAGHNFEQLKIAQIAPEPISNPFCHDNFSTKFLWRKVPI
jgi:hypothetical protein